MKQQLVSLCYPGRLYVVIPGPPVPLARPRTVRTKHGKTRTFTPDRSANYEERVALFARAAIGRTAWPKDRRYAVTIRVYRAKAIGDWDNYAKGICDGMNGVVWNDDRQVCEGHVYVEDDKLNPRAEVTVVAMGVAE